MITRFRRAKKRKGKAFRRLGGRRGGAEDKLAGVNGKKIVCDKDGKRRVAQSLVANDDKAGSASSRRHRSGQRDGIAPQIKTRGQVGNSPALEALLALGTVPQLGVVVLLDRVPRRRVLLARPEHCARG